MKKKSILLISPDFFDYSKLLRNEFINKEYDLIYFNTSFPNIHSLKNRILRRISKNYIYKLQNKYFGDILEKIKKKEYDLALVIRCEGIPKFFLKELASLDNVSKRVLYEWDDLKKYKSTLEKLCFFDKVYSYNMMDADEFNLNLMPLFIKKISKSNFKKNDIFYIGTCKGNRYLEVLNFLKAFNSLKSDFYLFMSKSRVFLSLLTGKVSFRDRKKFITKNMDYEGMINKVSEAKCVLDLKGEGQTGLTTRVLEALSVRTKVITNNDNVKKYDFYDEKNIFIFSDISTIDEILFRKFLQEPFSDLKIPNLEKLCIENWVNQIEKI